MKSPHHGKHYVRHFACSKRLKRHKEAVFGRSSPCRVKTGKVISVVQNGVVLVGNAVHRKRPLPAAAPSGDKRRKLHEEALSLPLDDPPSSIPKGIAGCVHPCPSFAGGAEHVPFVRYRRAMHVISVTAGELCHIRCTFRLNWNRRCHSSVRSPDVPRYRD